MNKSIAILEPIEQGIKWFQDDQVSLSIVYKTFGVTMKHSFQNMQCLTDEEQLYISKLVAERLCFMYGDAIGISYLLDPVMIGDSMLDAHRNRAETALFDSVSCSIVITEENQDDIDNKKEQLFKEYTEWIIHAREFRRKNDFKFKMLLKGTKTALQYWQIDGISYPVLSKEAIKVFSMVTSSASSEREFSSMAFIHSKLRNRLGNDKVNKLIFIKNNAGQVFCQKDTYWKLSDDEDEEVTSITGEKCGLEDFNEDSE